MKTSCFLAALCLWTSAVFAGETLIDETFSALPDPGEWKSVGDAKASGGKLELIASGDESAFVNSGLQKKDPLSGMNFVRQPVKIQVSKLELGGEALPEKQAFIVLLATGRPSETEAAAYLRLCVDGDGRLSLAASAGQPGEGRGLETLASMPVAFPLSEIEVQLDPKGYRIEYKDAAGSQESEGDWADKIDPSAWQGADPSLVIKAVRRPGEGTANVSLGGFKATNP